MITILLVIPMGFSFWLIAALTLFHGNTLYHLDTINKDGHVYHLAYGEYGKGDLIADKHLLLFTCDDVCTASGRISFPYSTFENKFSINEKNQLQVVDGKRIVFTLDDE